MMYIVASITIILDAYDLVLLTHQQAAFLNPALFLTVFHVHVHCVDECLQLVTMQQWPHTVSQQQQQQAAEGELSFPDHELYVLEIAAGSNIVLIAIYEDRASMQPHSLQATFLSFLV